MSKIEASLQKLYEKHRIVVWYDAAKAFEEDFSGMALPGVAKITVAGDELAVKIRVLAQEPAQPFLLYMPYARPAPEDNWLLDIELSQTLFQSDPDSLRLQELELPAHYQSWVRQHSRFFQSKERLQKFKTLAESKDDTNQLTNKVIQVLFGAAQSDIDTLLRAYVKAFSEDRAAELADALEKYGLTAYFWDEAALHYKVENPSGNVYDFVLKLFGAGFGPLCGAGRVSPVARVALSNWKDLRSFAPVFAFISGKVAADLNVAHALEKAVLEEVQDEDFFEVIDQWIVRDLVRKTLDGTFDSGKVRAIVKSRENRHWAEKYEPYYHALLSAAQLLEAIAHADFTVPAGLEEGFEQYTRAGYKVDQQYRHFIRALRQAPSAGMLQPLYERVEKKYTNDWLLPLSEGWQRCLAKHDGWYAGAKSQASFWRTVVQEPYVAQKRKVFVIISDALRYEIGEELHRSIGALNKFECRLDYRVSGLPSYTQLGMALLLPHRQISLGESDDIWVDGLSSKGLQARAKILNANGGGARATAISAEDLNAYAVKSDEANALVQNHDVVYVYHNVIDKTGDDKVSEERVFDAAAGEIQFLTALIRRIASNNITHMVITADHGFIYQAEALPESDFADAGISGNVTKSNRRFVMGHNLTHNDAVTAYPARQLGLNADAQVLIPKGMSRLRRQGAGSRFVHGGATLQEVVIPVLTIAKKRDDTVSQIEVDVLNKGVRKITTHIQPVTFYQSKAVANRVKGRNIKAYFAVENSGGVTVISDVFIHFFDSASGLAEDWQRVHNFKIATTLQRHAAVWLVLEDQIAGATEWRPYNRYPFSLALGMTNDFDDF